MWLITYSQNNIIANTHAHKDENPAQWLARICQRSAIRTVLLFAVEVPDEDARKI